MGESGPGRNEGHEAPRVGKARAAPRILGVGTVALDTVETPWGSARDVPGGSALYFAAAASALGPVAVVGVTGDDFPAEPLARLEARGVDVSGITRHPHPTFRWRARYDASGVREILSVHRGGILTQVPRVPAALRGPDVLFLGSTHPRVQATVLEQAGAPELVLLDTMPHWIRDGREVLEALLRRVDVLLVSGDEARMLGGAEDEDAAAVGILAMGPRWVVVTRGADGACAYGAGERVEVAAVPAPRVVDPTGAGDAFAGGVAATLARRGLDGPAMSHALAAGARLGALAVGSFSFDGLVADP